MMTSCAFDMAGLPHQQRCQLCRETAANYVVKPDTVPLTLSRSHCPAHTVPLTLSRSAACEVRCRRTAGLKDRLGTAGNRLVCLFRRSIVRCSLLLGLASGCGMVGCDADVMREADRAARLGRPRLRWWLRVMWRRRLAG